ncbi:unnamed protein product [Boreogadus saida]
MGKKEDEVVEEEEEEEEEGGEEEEEEEEEEAVEVAAEEEEEEEEEEKLVPLQLIRGRLIWQPEPSLRSGLTDRGFCYALLEIWGVRYYARLFKVRGSKEGKNLKLG